MKYILACQREKEMHTTHLQLMRLLQLAITFLICLFAALITVDGTSHDNKRSGHGKTTCGDNEDALKYLNKSS